MIMMLERCPEEGSRIDWAAGATADRCNLLPIEDQPCI
jgi:hypothetical protein